MHRMLPVFLFLLLFGCILLQAQNPVSIHITEKEGLPDKEFYGVLEDDNGFIWLAGNKGLTRFDGTTYKTLEHPEKRGLSMFEPRLDAHGRVWSINISGQLFYTQGDALVLFADLSKTLKGSLGNLALHKGYVYVGTESTLIAIEIETKKKTITNIAVPNIYAPVVITQNIEGDLWYGRNGVIYSLNSAKERKLHTLPASFRNIEKRIGIGKFVKLPNGEALVYFQNDKGKKTFFELKETTWKKIALPKEIADTYIIKITFYEDTCWILTNIGVFTGSYSNGTFSLTNHFLKENFTTNVARDQDNNYWITTLRNGLYVLPNIYINTIDFPERYGKPTRIIKGNKDNIVIGTTSGDAIAHHTNEHTSQVFDMPSGRPVTALYFDEYRNEYGILQETRQFKLSAEAPKKVTDLTNKLGTTKEFTFVDANTIIAVTSGNAYELEYPLKDVNPTKVALYNREKRGYTCFYDKHSMLRYYGLVDQLLAVDAAGNETEILTPKNSSILAASISATTNGTIWAATYKNGLYAIKGTKVIAHITEADGLLSNKVSSIAADGTALWIATDSGIQQYNTQTKKFKNLNKQDGIPSYSIKNIVPVGNTIFFGSNEAVFSIDNTKAFKQLTVPELYITQVVINNESLPLQKEYTIKQDKSKVKILFNANGLRGLSSGKYEYRLLGVEDSWTQLKVGVNEVQFTNLPKGSITFQLRTAETISSETRQVEINFKVTEAFYNALWFWVLVLVASVLLVVYYFRRKIKRREEQKNKELAQLALDNELNALKLENLRSQMNPHFIFNALNSIQEYIVSNEKNLASSYLVKFSRLIRMYLDQSRENLITLEEELAAMRLYLELEQIRFETALQYNLIVNVAPPTKSLQVPPLFIQPYIENALKHGLLHVDNRQLDITFTYHEARKLLEVTVQDNGIGRKASEARKKDLPHEHTSFATSANERRVRLLNKNVNKTITVEIIDLYKAKIATGTKVVVKIPQG